MPPKQRKQSALSESELEYTRSLKFLAERNTAEGAGADKAFGEIISLKALYDPELWKSNSVRIVQAYTMFNTDVSVKHVNYEQAMKVVEECVDFFNTHICDTNKIGDSNLIVFCHPYLDAVAGNLMYSKNPKKPNGPPLTDVVGITQTCHWGDVLKDGIPWEFKAHVIGLSWKLMDHTENDYHELRDTVLHELAHALLYSANIGEEVDLWNRYERHHIPFTEKMEFISCKWAEVYGKAFGFTNCGPHHKDVKLESELAIVFDPERPEECRDRVKYHFGLYDGLYDGVMGRKAPAKKRPSGKRSKPQNKRRRR